MAMELYYTSAPKGLKPGTSGFCTVAVTTGITAPMIQQLESLSGYRPIYRVGHRDVDRNPITHAHWRAPIGGRFCNILSRVCFAGADYTQRSNKFAHHLLVDSDEQTSAGPAWVMMQPGVMEEKWTGAPRVLPTGRQIPKGTNPLRVCDQWAKATGDAGWAGVLVDSFILDANKPVYILFKPGMNLLPLINEAIALLPEHLRWKATFSTYFDQLPPGLTCTWRCCAKGTAAAKTALVNAAAGVVIDLTKNMPAPRDSRYVTMARTGQAMPDVAEETVTVPDDFNEPKPWGPRRDSEGSQRSGLLDDISASVSAEKNYPPVRPTGADFLPRRRRRALLWAVGVGLPIFVVCLGLIIWQQIQSATKVPIHLPTNVEELEARVALLEKEKEEVEGERDKARGEKASLKTELEGKLSEKDLTIASLEEQVTDLKTQLARLKGVVAPPPSKGPVGTPKPRPVRPTDEKPVATKLGGEWYAVKLPSRRGPLGNLQPSETLLLNDLPADAEVRIQLPVDTQDAETEDGTIEVKSYRFVHEDGGLNILYDYHDGLGHAGTAKLAAAKIENGSLWWDWLASRATIKKDDLPLDPLVRYSVLHVVSPEGTTLREVQLTECKNLAFSLKNDSEPSSHEWASANPELIVMSVPKRWTLQPEEHRGLQKIKTPNGAEFQVSIIGHPESDSDDDQIHTEWVSANPFKMREPNRQLTPENLSKEHADYQAYTKKRGEMIGNIQKAIERKEKELEIPDLRERKTTTEKRRDEADRNVVKLKRELHKLAPQLRTNETRLKNAREQLKKEREKGSPNIGRLEEDIRNYKAELERINDRDDVQQAKAKIRKAEDVVNTIQRNLGGIQFELEEKLEHEELRELRERKAEREDEKAKRKNKWDQFDREYKASKQKTETLAKQKQDVESMTGTIRLEVQAEHSGARLGTIEITK